VYSQSQKPIKDRRFSIPISGRVHILSKIAIAKKQTIEKRKNLNLLNSVPFENGFHFFTELGKYTRITASSTVEFAEKLQIIPIQSVTFHFQRQDFQKWLRNTVGDEELAKRIDQIKAGSQDENLRKELFKTVHNRITELTKSSQQTSS
jgi:Family of unknown function (DUF5752)